MTRAEDVVGDVHTSPYSFGGPGSLGPQVFTLPSWNTCESPLSNSLCLLFLIAQLFNGNLYHAFVFHNFGRTDGL